MPSSSRCDNSCSLYLKKEEEILAKIDVLSERYLAMRKRIPLLVVTVLTMCLTMAFVVLIVWFKQRPLKVCSWISFC